MKQTLLILTMGFALFAMFFGAGNLVFPLKIGVTSHENWPFALLGFGVTAVLVPLLGFIAMTLFGGDYMAFFSPLGKKAGLACITLILLLLGPCAVVARCIALCHTSVQRIYPALSSFEFALMASCVVFLFSFRENRIVPILGRYLTPLKLATLGLLIVQGLITSPTGTLGMPCDPKLFWNGMSEGLETLDLLAALAFSCFLCPRLKAFETQKQSLEKIALKVAAICGLLLFGVYLGFCFVAARHSAALTTTPNALLITQLAEHLLGPWGAHLTILVVLLACLTTVIALSSIFAEFMKRELFKDKISYTLSLSLTLTLACIVSLLQFDGIVAFLLPLMEVAYPALIVLCLLHILQRYLGPKVQPLPFYATFGATLAYKLFT